MQSGFLYHLFGYLSSVFILFPLYGIYLQLNLIWKRKKNNQSSNATTQNISLYRTFASYFAFFATFLLGLALPKTDPYMVSSRFIALALSLLILWEIFIDRRTKASILTLIFCISLPLVSSLTASLNRLLLTSNVELIKYFIIIATLILVHGYYVQITILIKSKNVGALSKGMYRCFLVKEISTFAFALTLGNENGWPLYFMHGTLFLCEIVILGLISKYEPKNHKN
jgi:uncharacterized protein with PQ loop repeat